MRKCMFGVIFAVFLATGASATLVTDSSSFPPSSLVIDFSQFTGANQYAGTNGPVQVGGLVGADVIFTSANDAGYLYDDTWGLGANGNWTSARDGYAGVDSFNGNVMIFTFATPVADVGAFINYGAGFGSVMIEALGAGNIVLESYDLTSAAPISTPGATDGGAFRGIVRLSADIVALRINSAAFPVIDNLTFSGPAPSSIPATSRLGLVVLCLLLALCGVAVLKLRG